MGERAAIHRFNAPLETHIHKDFMKSSLPDLTVRQASKEDTVKVKFT